MIVVKKFGGSSVATLEHIKKVANFIKKSGDKKVVVVVSAMGKTTNNLLSKVQEISPNKSCDREIDQLLSTGEIESVSLLALRLNKIGVPAVSLNGRQAKIHTNSQFGNAHINSIDINQIVYYLKQKKVVVVAGFQGVDKFGNITTLGRGGSDTTAVALASALKADCQIYSDIDGIYRCNPHYYNSKKIIKEIDYDSMLEMAFNGTKAMEVRAVEIAKKYDTKIYLSKSLNMNKNKGTYILKKDFEYVKIQSLSVKENLEFIKISFKKDEEKNCDVIYKLLKLDCNFDSFKKREFNNKIEYTFCIENKKLKDLKKIFKGKRITHKNLSKITLVGSGIATHPKLILKIEKTLQKSDIEIKNIDLSEIAISLFVNNENLKDAVNILAKFFKL